VATVVMAVKDFMMPVILSAAPAGMPEGKAIASSIIRCIAGSTTATVTTREINLVAMEVQA
jgi:hypothetical protein